MKVSELITKLMAVKKQYGDIECVASSNGGNTFSTITFNPTPGKMKVIKGSFNHEVEFLLCNEDEVSCVCIN